MEIILFFQNALNIGNASNAAISGQPPLVAATVPVTSNESSTNPSVIPTVQPTPTFPASSCLMPPLETIESSSGNINRATSLVKPSFFTPAPSTLAMPQAASITPNAPPLYPPVTMQRPYGTPLLQPFPPPAPSASLTPAPNYGPILTKEKVRAALLRLVQVSFLPFCCTIFFLIRLDNKLLVLHWMDWSPYNLFIVFLVFK